MDTFSSTDAFPGTDTNGLAAGRDYFQPFTAMPVARVTSETGIIAFFKRNATMLSVLALLAALAVGAFMVWRARKHVGMAQGPFGADIAKVQDVERREDAKEWQYLLQLARRASVKAVLRDVLARQLSSDASTEGTGRPPMPKENASQSATQSGATEFTMVDGGATHNDPLFTPVA